MPLVAAHRISMHYGGPLLLEDVTVKVEPGERIGLIGRNGSGKTTLLKLLGGALEPSDGRVVLPRGTTIAYQAQELEFEPGATIFDEMRRIFHRETRREARLREVEASLSEGLPGPERTRLLREYSRLQEEQAQGRVYDVDQSIARCLSHLGLGESTWEKPIETFSGGERNVIGLARVLLSHPDLMLLDEPSNHLDMEGVEWFIDFLRRARAAILMVSHNRHLLDATMRRIWELEGRRVTAWTGNYSDFQRQKAEAVALQERRYKTQQRLIRRIEFQARRLMDMANAYDDPGQAKRAKAMLRRLERMDKVDRPAPPGATFRAALGGAGRHGRIALSVHDFSHAFGDRLLFDHAELEVEYGERLCLVGPNGSGKTTLVRRILDEGSWENPTLRLGKSVRVAEYRQLHDILDADATLLDDTVQATGLREKEAAALLHRFHFAREDLDRPVHTLSGGEKSRLQLARLAQAKVNFLILDEPTNHLDIPSCEVLEEMLQEFDGTLVVISHDRYFLDKLVDRVVEVKDRGLVSWPMTFAAWWAEQVRGRSTRRGALEDREGAGRDKAAARDAHEARLAERRTRNRQAGRLRRLEREIEALEGHKATLTAAMEAVWARGGGDADEARRAAEMGCQLEVLEASLRDHLRRWTSAAEAAEAEGNPG
ncbi:MAG: ribosomal protection-like ABC-F family protein [Planctomycetota bacterium]